MGEKRFALLLPNAIINDTIVRKSYYLSEKEHVEKIVALLNRQDYAIEVKQKYIEKLEKQLEQIPKSIREVWLE